MTKLLINQLTLPSQLTFSTYQGGRMTTSGKLEITIKISEFPADVRTALEQLETV